MIDGDGIRVLHDKRQKQTRLWGIDCREKNQDFGTKAKHVTSNLVFAKVMEVEPVTKDRYGRTVAFVKVGDTLVNEERYGNGLLGSSPGTAIDQSAIDGRRWRRRHERRNGGSTRCRSR